MGAIVKLAPYPCVVVRTMDHAAALRHRASHTRQKGGEEAESHVEWDVMTRCRQLEAEIKRHCNNVSSIVIENLLEAVCEFCGRDWEVDVGRPSCCEKAMHEWDVQLARAERLQQQTKEE